LADTRENQGNSMKILCLHFFSQSVSWCAKKSHKKTHYSQNEIACFHFPWWKKGTLLWNRHKFASIALYCDSIVCSICSIPLLNHGNEGRNKWGTSNFLTGGWVFRHGAKNMVNMILQISEKNSFSPSDGDLACPDRQRELWAPSPTGVIPW